MTKRPTNGYAAFRKAFARQRDDVYRDIFLRNQTIIGIKKERVAIANLRRIVEATLRISNRSSFHSMSLRDLSREAQMSMGALYAYIDSKEALLQMILQQVLTVVTVVLGNPPDRLDGPRERLDWLLQTHIFLSESMQPWFFFAYMEAKAFDRVGRKAAVDSELYTEGLIADVIREGCARGIFHVADPQIAASLVKPLLQDWYLKPWKHKRRGLSADDFAEWVTAFVESFLIPDGERARQRRPLPVLAVPDAGRSGVANDEQN